MYLNYMQFYLSPMTGIGSLYMCVLQFSYFADYLYYCNIKITYFSTDISLRRSLVFMMHYLVETVVSIPEEKVL